VPLPYFLSNPSCSSYIVILPPPPLQTCINENAKNGSRQRL
jgi:hypothetical protein